MLDWSTVALRVQCAGGRGKVGWAHDFSDCGLNKYFLLIMTELELVMERKLSDRRGILLYQGAHEPNSEYSETHSRKESEFTVSHCDE